MPFPHVTIAMSPGWGSQVRHATLDENGVLTKSQFWGVPRISRQLTGEEHRDLVLKMLIGTALPEGEREPGCADADRYELSWRTPYRTGSLRLLCGLATDRMPDAIVNRVRFFEEFNRLYDEMVERLAPWAGVTYAFRTDRQVYRSGDSLTVFLNLSNPTDSTRTLYFGSEQAFRFWAQFGQMYASAPADPWKCTSGVALGYQDDCLGPSVSIAPGDSVNYRRTVAIADFGFTFLPCCRWELLVRAGVNLPLASFDSTMTVTIWG